MRVLKGELINVSRYQVIDILFEGYLFFIELNYYKILVFNDLSNIPAFK